MVKQDLNSRILFFVFMFLVVVLCIFGYGAISEAVSYSVDSVTGFNCDPSVNPACGNSDNPFKTIQYAINVASPGDTIYVASGTYNENITMKSGINVIGSGPASTIISGIADVNGIVNFTNVDCAILAGFSITVGTPVAGTDRGVVFEGATGYRAVLQNCIIYGVQYGIFVLPPASPSIVNNVLDGKDVDEQGIQISFGLASPIIYNNIITKYLVAGIHVYDTVATPSIMYNDLWNNTPNYWGIADQTGSNGNISSSPLFNPDYSLGTGSPCIDAGYPNPEFSDYLDNTRNDMGAYGGGRNTLLDVSTTGTGSGVVVSAPSSGLPVPGLGYPDTITCPPLTSCAAYYYSGSQITLTATPNVGSYLAGWSGCGCFGSAPSCTHDYYLFYTPIHATFSQCSYSISPSTAGFSYEAGTGSISVASPSTSCSWTATSNNPWITISSASGGTVLYSVEGNPDGIARTGTMTIGGQTFTVNQGAGHGGCNFAINPYKAVVSASAGTYYVDVIGPSGCSWTAGIAGGLWLSGGAEGTGSGTVMYTVQENTGPARSATMTVAGLPFVVEQADKSYMEGLTLVSVSPPGGPIWVTATFTNTTGQTIQTIKPDCCNNTYFWVTNAEGLMVPPIDRVCEPVGIPDSLVFIPPGSFSITCNLGEMYNLTQGSYEVMATYGNTIRDPDYMGGGCSNPDRTTCYNLWTGTVPSAKTALSIQGSPVQTETVALTFNPLQWDLLWASVDGPAISATITDTGPKGGNTVAQASSVVTCSNVNVNTIKLNGQVPIIPGSCMDTTGGIIVQFNRTAAVNSLGSMLVPGTTVYPAIQGSLNNPSNTTFFGQGSVGLTITITTGLIVQANVNTVGQGQKPATSKEPLFGMEIRVYDTKQGSCAAGYSMSWQNYPSIWSQCTPVTEALTDANGQAIFPLPSGNYVAIGKYKNIYPGVSVGSVSAGSVVNKYLQIIQTANGTILPAKYQQFTGSNLLVIEPEYVEWSGTQEVYPFIYDSLGDWGVSVSVNPPEGFVADQKSLSTEVSNTLTALQFTITDVGSKWVSTKVNHQIKHKGKTTNVDSRIGLKLAPGLQKKLGLGEFGEQE